MGQDYYAKLRAQLNDMLRAGTINAADMKYLYYTDSVEDMSAYIASTVQRFGVIPRPAPSRILRETPLVAKPSKHDPKVPQH
jgi:predicted Rossmann-fold nucleotide-binding protein